MTQSLPSFAAPLVTIVLVTLAIGLPILTMLAIRFLWDRNLNLGRSRELEKLIWQLHRIASAIEQQMNLSPPAVQPGTEKPHGVANTQQLATQGNATTRSVAADAVAAEPATQPVRVEQPGTAPPAAQHASVPLSAPQGKPSEEGDRQGGVNSMFGL